jgi:hypothetical protein
MLTYADVCWRMLTYSDVCWRMLTYADVCWRILTYAAAALQIWAHLLGTTPARLVVQVYACCRYADVCWRMLTYADVCWASAPISPKQSAELSSCVLIWGRFSVYLLYWYKSTNTARAAFPQSSLHVYWFGADAQFTYFNGTKVQILHALPFPRALSMLADLEQILSLLTLLVQKYKYCTRCLSPELSDVGWFGADAQFTYFTGTKVQMLFALPLQVIGGDATRCI